MVGWPLSHDSSRGRLVCEARKNAFQARREQVSLEYIWVGHNALSKHDNHAIYMTLKHQVIFLPSSDLSNVDQIEAEKCSTSVL